MAEPLMEARALSKRFTLRTGSAGAQRSSLIAVDRVDCAWQPGQTLGLVGESGCGKTTLAKLLVGLLTPSGGDVLIQGRPLSALRGPELLSARRAVQLIFQDPTNSLDPRLSIGQILAEPLSIHRMASSRQQRAQRVKDLLQLVQLPASYAGRLPRELSGGERQRVGIARALAINPAGLICDEPIASLDVSVGAQIIELLRTLSRERQVALLFISHDLRAVAALCETIAVMKQGRLVETGTADEVLSRPRDPYTALLIRSAQLDLDAAPGTHPTD